MSRTFSQPFTDGPERLTYDNLGNGSIEPGELIGNCIEDKRLDSKVYFCVQDLIGWMNAKVMHVSGILF